jgi:tetratricopeptide (TPR) repeat protein
MSRTSRYIGLGFVTSGTLVLALIVVDGHLAGLALFLSALLSVGGTYIYRRATGARWWRVLSDCLIALVPLLGPVSLLLHMGFLEAGVTARWALRVPAVLFAGMLTAILVYWTIDYVSLWREGKMWEYVERGRTLEQEERLDEAIAWYRQAIAVNPTENWAYGKLGDALSRKGDWDGAIAAYQEATRLPPEIGSFHYQIAVALEEKGSLDEAIAEYREAIRLPPPNAHAYSNLGDVYRKKGLAGEARQAYREALRSKYLENFLEGKASMDHYNAKRKVQDWDGVLAWCQEIVRLDPEFPRARVALGFAYGSKGDWDGAIVAYREAVRLEPDNADSHRSLSFALAKKQQWRLALTHARAAVRLDPKSAAAHRWLARTLSATGDPHGALAEARQAGLLSREPEPLVYFYRAEVLRTQGRREACQAYQDFLQLAGQNHPGYEREMQTAQQALRKL